jgi:ribosomal protein S18 acetylase RimI-like enzyme
MALTIEEVNAPAADLAADIGRLVAQLSSSATTPTADELDELTQSSACHLLIARDGAATVVGMLTLVIFRIPTGIRAWIEDVVVDHDARGQGVGESLTQAAIELAQSAGARTVDLTSRPTREAANRLYRKMGFALRDSSVYRIALPGD